MTVVGGQRSTAQDRSPPPQGVVATGSGASTGGDPHTPAGRHGSTTVEVAADTDDLTAPAAGGGSGEMAGLPGHRRRPPIRAPHASPQRRAAAGVGTSLPTVLESAAGVTPGNDDDRASHAVPTAWEVPWVAHTPAGAPPTAHSPVVVVQPLTQPTGAVRGAWTLPELLWWCCRVRRMAPRLDGPSDASDTAGGGIVVHGSMASLGTVGSGNNREVRYLPTIALDTTVTPAAPTVGSAPAGGETPSATTPSAVSGRAVVDGALASRRAAGQPVVGHPLLPFTPVPGTQYLLRPNRVEPQWLDDGAVALLHDARPPTPAAQTAAGTTTGGAALIAPSDHTDALTADVGGGGGGGGSGTDRITRTGDDSPHTPDAAVVAVEPDHSAGGGGGPSPFTAAETVILRMEVVDNGRGIPLHRQRKLFSELQQFVALQAGAGQTAAMKGTGLGLFVSRKLVERHGGRVGLSSTGVLGQPTTFWLEVPLRVMRVAGPRGNALDGQPVRWGGDDPEPTTARWRGPSLPTATDAGSMPSLAPPSPLPSLPPRPLLAHSLTPHHLPQLPPDVDMLPGAVTAGDRRSPRDTRHAEASSTHAPTRTESRPVAEEPPPAGGSLTSAATAIMLPLPGDVAPEMSMGMRSSSGDSTAAGPTSDLPPFTLLIVEDVAMLRKLLSRSLRRYFPQAELLEAENGAQAVEIWSRLTATQPHHAPAVITMDYNMPIMDGEEAVRRLRRLGCTSLIVGITGNAMGHDLAAFSKCGVDTVFTKPVRAQDLVTVMSTYLRGGRTAAGLQPLPDPAASAAAAVGGLGREYTPSPTRSTGSGSSVRGIGVGVDDAVPADSRRRGVAEWVGRLVGDAPVGAGVPADGALMVRGRSVDRGGGGGVVGMGGGKRPTSGSPLAGRLG